MSNSTQAQKRIKCYQCNSNELTAYFYFNMENKPVISFDCAKCKEPIMGIEISMDSLKMVVNVEDLVKSLKE